MKKKKEVIMSIVNGELVECEHPDSGEHIEAQSNEPLDRTLITKETKKELAKALKKYPEIKPIIEILIGKKSTKELK